jgi:hypothetical protein
MELTFMRYLLTLLLFFMTFWVAFPGQVAAATVTCSGSHTSTNNSQVYYDPSANTCTISDSSVFQNKTGAIAVTLAPLFPYIKISSDNDLNGTMSQTDNTGCSIGDDGDVGSGGTCYDGYGSGTIASGSYTNTVTAFVATDTQAVLTINYNYVDTSSFSVTSASMVLSTVDGTSPSVAIQNAPTSVGTDATFNVTFEFSEDVTGFTVDDISVGNGSASNFSATDATTYTADITPDGSTNNVTIDVAAGAAQDGASNTSTVATTTTVTYVVDTTPPHPLHT